MASQARPEMALTCKATIKPWKVRHDDENQSPEDRAQRESENASTGCRAGTAEGLDVGHGTRCTKPHPR